MQKDSLHDTGYIYSMIITHCNRIYFSISNVNNDSYTYDIVVNIYIYTGTCIYLNKIGSN